MRTGFVFVTLFLLFQLPSSNVYAADYTNSLLFKVTIWQDGVETEFEFENPSHYEWENGSTVIKGEKAKEKVKELYNRLEISNKVEKEHLLVSLQHEFPNLDGFVVRWIDPNNNLYTWHWNRKENQKSE
ncbi:hypothetical protein ACFSCX_22935 [Bacillus salitolerans]|uniref:Uncharacterized protein n=1 Tax=Bacillus salitolerans TaxID=1437434 RepID=A0ABW4LWP1_9BACI